MKSETMWQVKLTSPSGTEIALWPSSAADAVSFAIAYRAKGWTYSAMKVSAPRAVAVCS